MDKQKLLAYLNAENDKEIAEVDGTENRIKRAMHTQGHKILNKIIRRTELGEFETDDTK